MSWKRFNPMDPNDPNWRFFEIFASKFYGGLVHMAIMAVAEAEKKFVDGFTEEMRYELVIGVLETMNSPVRYVFDDWKALIEAHKGEQAAVAAQNVKDEDLPESTRERLKGVGKKE